MAWTKYMEDNQDFFTENNRNRKDELSGIDINRVVCFNHARLTDQARASYSSKSTQQSITTYRHW